LLKSTPVVPAHSRDCFVFPGMKLLKTSQRRFDHDQDLVRQSSSLWHLLAMQYIPVPNS
jgi:hypothetical protein